MRVVTLDLLILRVPLQWWIVLPVVVLLLYAVFRWRRFGEDAYTWNYEHFKLALAFGMAVWALALSARHLHLKPWEHAALWAGILVVTGLVLRFSRSQSWVNTALLSAAIAVVGPGSTLLADAVGYALYRPVKIHPAERDTYDRYISLVDSDSYLALPLPYGWQNTSLGIGNALASTYRRDDAGSGACHISVYPNRSSLSAHRPAPTGAYAEEFLAKQLARWAQDDGLGQRNSISHEDIAIGPMAVADYQTNEHGHVRYWMVLSPKADIVIAYEDGKPPAAEREIAEIYKALKSASFKTTSPTNPGVQSLHAR